MEGCASALAGLRHLRSTSPGRPVGHLRDLGIGVASVPKALRSLDVIAAVLTGAQRLELREFPDPEPAPNGVVVDISHCGVCGTDLHAYSGGGFQAPANCGHEWSGTVAAVGRGVVGLAEGDRVLGAVPPPCGTCPSCAAGHGKSCTTVLMVAAGMDADAPPHGAFASRVAVAADRVMQVDAALSDEEAAMVEPATVAYRAVRRSGLVLGDLTVVIGAGPIGLLVMQWARVAGAGEVLVVEPDPARQAMALALGASAVAAPGAEGDQLVRDRSGGLGADMVFECAGRPGTIQGSVDTVRRGGSVCLVGVSEEPETIVPTVWLIKELSLVASLAYERSDFATTMSMMAAGRVRVAPLHTSTACLAGLPEVFASLSKPGSAQTKVLVRPDGWC